MVGSQYLARTPDSAVAERSRRLLQTTCGDEVQAATLPRLMCMRTRDQLTSTDVAGMRHAAITQSSVDDASLLHVDAAS